MSCELFVIVAVVDGVASPLIHVKRAVTMDMVIAGIGDVGLSGWCYTRAQAIPSPCRVVVIRSPRLILHSQVGQTKEKLEVVHGRGILEAVAASISLFS